MLTPVSIGPEAIEMQGRNLGRAPLCCQTPPLSVPSMLLTGRHKLDFLTGFGNMETVLPPQSCSEHFNVISC